MRFELQDVCLQLLYAVFEFFYFVGLCRYYLVSRLAAA